MEVTSMRSAFAVLLFAMLTAVGCNSPYRADRGALFGGLTGAGVGALVGEAVGAPAAGAAIGAGVGAVTGGVVGGSLDDIEARNRAEIAANMQRPVPAGAVTTDDVVALTRAGVSEDVIATQIRTRGLATPIQATDLIILQQQGVSPRVVQAMQSQPAGPVGPAGIAGPQVMYGGPPPMVIQEYYGPPPPYWGPPPYGFYYRGGPWRRPPHGGVSWGVAVGN